MKVVKISAMWCSGCLVMNRIWDKVKIKKQMEIIELDYDFDAEQVEKYHPGKILPVFIFYSSDKEVLRIVGEKSEQELLEMIEKVEL